MGFNVTLEEKNGVARIALEGELDASVADKFKQTVEQAAALNPSKLVLLMGDLAFMASAGLRVLIFAKQKMGEKVGIYLIGASGPVLKTIQMSGFHQSVYLQDSFTE